MLTSRYLPYPFTLMSWSWIAIKGNYKAHLTVVTTVLQRKLNKNTTLKHWNRSSMKQTDFPSYWHLTCVFSTKRWIWYLGGCTGTYILLILEIGSARNPHRKSCQVHRTGNCLHLNVTWRWGSTMLTTVSANLFFRLGLSKATFTLPTQSSHIIRNMASVLIYFPTTKANPFQNWYSDIWWVSTCQQKTYCIYVTLLSWHPL